MSKLVENQLENRAIPFITYNKESHLFSLNPECIEMIQNINTSFSVVSIAGMYRTGKSYLLNKVILNKSKNSQGFIVGKTVNACTKGLWIYDKPIIGINEDGENIPVLIVDTEGFGSIEEDINHDIKIFTLSVLISSCFIYNSVGSIDESSIEALNFVVNLSKFIQLNNNSVADESDFFPSLLWILRDFALQLHDNENHLTPQDYLENALNTSKNSSIKQAIKMFFKDRDCFTLVRPVTNETDLQNLDTLHDEKLRTQFIEQSIFLRKKILNNCKTKIFKGRHINGHQFLAIIESYLQMMNSGLIPNIDTIWNSLCTSEAFKAIETAEKEYERCFKEIILLNSFKSFTSNEMHNTHLEAKEKALQMFKLKSIGDDNLLGNFNRELKQKLKEKFEHFNKLNEDQIRTELHKFLKKRFENIEIRVKNFEVHQIFEIENLLNIVERELGDNFQESIIRNEVLLDFKYRLILFASSFLMASLNNHLESVIEEKSQSLNKYKSELSELKEKLDKESKKKDTLIDELKNETCLLKLELNQYKEKFSIEGTENQQTIKLLNENLENMKKEYTREKENFNLTIQNLEESKLLSERKSIKMQADFDKEKALLEQKIDHLTKIVDESNRREKISGQDLKSQLKEQSIAMKENSLKYEKTLKELSDQIEKFKEKVIDLESSVNNKDNLIELEKIRNEEIQMKSRNERDILNDKIFLFKKKLEDHQQNYKVELDNKNKELLEFKNLMKIKEQEYGDRLQTIEEELKKQNKKLEKENILLKQDNEFLDIKCKELSAQLAEHKNNQDKIIQALQSKINSSDNIQTEELKRKLEEITEFYSREKKQNELAFEKEKQALSKEITNLQEKLILRGKSEEENDQMVLDLKNEIIKLNKQVGQLTNEKNQLEEDNHNTQKELFHKIKQFNDEFDAHLQEKEKIYQDEIKNLNLNSEESLNQFKSLFEIEKIRIEEKLKEEKIKHENKMKLLQEENELRIKEIEKELKSELEELQEEHSQLELDHQNYVYNAEHEVSLLNQKTETLENNLREAKESLANLQTQFNQAMESKTDAFNKERKELQEKIDESRNLNNKKEKEIASLNLKKETLEKTISENEHAYMLHRKELEDDIRELITKHENYKSKQQEILDELLIKKLEFTRETALLKQQIEFLNTKFEEQTRINEQNQLEYEESIHTIRSDLIREFNQKIENINREKEDLADRFNKKKKELRDLEQTFLKQTCLVEKEKNVLNDKIQQLGMKKKEISENHQFEFEKLAKELNVNKTEHFKEISQYISNIDELKSKNKDLLHSIELFEKEKGLYETKIKYVEKQRDDFRRELLETQSKVEKLVEALQKKFAYDKNQIEIIYQDKLNEVEKKYQTQIYELQNNHENLYSEMVNHNKELEKELKSLLIQAGLRNKTLTDPNAVNRKINDLIELQEKLRTELEESKRDKNFSDYQVYGDREKELLKLKINDVEQRYKEVDAKRSMMLIEHEKEKARWALEKEHLTSNIIEHEETIDRLQKKIESLLRENEKYKADKDVIKDKEKEYYYKKLNNIKSSSTNTNFEKEMGHLNNINFNSLEYNKPRIYNPTSKASSNITGSSKLDYKSMIDNMDKYENYDSVFNNKITSKSTSTSTSKNIKNK